MKNLRVLVLMHEDLVPPDSLEGCTPKQIAEWKSEYDVMAALEQLGHDVQALGVRDDLTPIRKAIRSWKPHVAFVMLEEFHGVPTYDQAVVSYLELMRQPYTGCNARGLMITHDKALSKKILTYHRIPTPHFAVMLRNRQVRRPKRLQFPLIVKSATEDASLGIAQRSIVQNDEALVERVKFIHENIQSDALVEEYIDGREMYMGVMGNRRLQTFPLWEMHFKKMPEDVARIATAKVKWDSKYQEKHGIETGPAKDLPEGLAKRIANGCKRIYRALHMSGYGRMDLRLTPEGKVYVIEANANPNLEYGEDFSESAESTGIGYESLIQKILNLGLAYDAPWKAYS